jgi:flagellar basal-body rod modification protein FlgD
MANEINNNSIFEQNNIQRLQQEKTKDRTTLDQEDFLRLMMTELQHQNPMEPMDNGKMLGQMAQFSTVTGINEMQGAIESLKGSLVSNQALEASGLVGRFVMVPSDHGYLPEGEGERFYGGVDLEQSAGNVVINIKTENGDLVKSMSLGSQPKGMVRFAWDGTNQYGEMMPPGKYKIESQARFDDKLEAVDPLFVAPVESVSIGQNNSDMRLNIPGIGALSMNQVKEIL